MDELRQLKPNLFVKKFKDQVADPKDNGLRVPLVVVKKSKKKKKKGGKKKK